MTGAPPMTEALALDQIVKTYGGITALKQVSFTVPSGTVFGIIGPNGAGKSTLVDVITGLTPPSSGSVTVLGHDTRGLPAHRVAALGVGRAFQRTALYAGSTVLENLRYGRLRLMRHSVLGRVIRSATYREDMRATNSQIEQIVHQAGLEDDADRIVGTLAYGIQRRVAIGTAMMTDPRLLLLDEPAAGMNEEESAALVTLVQRLSEGRTILIVEHDMSVISALCTSVLAMIDGAAVAVGTPHDVLRDPVVIEAYLGSDNV